MFRRSFLQLTAAAGLNCAFGRSSSFLQSQTDSFLNPIWMKRFSGQPASALVRRGRFRMIIDSNFLPVDSSVYAALTTPLKSTGSSNVPVSQVLREYMSVPDTVSVLHNRYIVASGSRSRSAPSRALLWVDTHGFGSYSQCPMFAALLDAGKNGNVLYLVSSPGTAKSQTSPLPPSFCSAFRHWLRAASTRNWAGGKVTTLALNVQGLSDATGIVQMLKLPVHRLASGMSFKA